MLGWTSWDILAQDIRYGWRTLRKSPGFAITAILTLALGIGASTAVFTVVDSVILKPLTYRDSGRLVVAWERVRMFSADPTGPNPRHFDLWRQRSHAFSSLTLVRNSSAGLTLGTDHPRLVGTVVGLPNLLDVLQVPPYLGRGFLPEDGTEGRDNVAILTYSLWQTLFHGDPGAIGRTIRIGDVPRQVVGVLPPGFQFPNGNALRTYRSTQSVSSVPEPAVLIPAVVNFDKIWWNGEYGNWVALGRLKPGASIREAETELNTIQAQVLREMPPGIFRGQPGDLAASVQPMHEAVVGDSRTGLWLLMAAVGGLMLIACLNLANAQLGRGMARRRDAAVRTALGAARWRLAWSALAESLILAAMGGAGGVLLAAVGVSLFRHYSPVDLPRLSEVHLNPAALCFSVALAFVACLLSGMSPAFRLLATDPHTSLQQNTNRALGSKATHRLRTWLIGLQVCGCTALLLVTGLFSKSLLYLLHQDKGFDTSRVAVAEVRLPSKSYGPDASRVAFDDAVLSNLRAIPGVQTAGLVSAMPLEGEMWIESLRLPDQPDRQPPLVNARWVSPGYFEATRQKLVAGRFFEERDRNLNSIVLTAGATKATWGSGDAIGKEVLFLGRTLKVIGVVADSHTTSLKADPTKIAYVHYAFRSPYTTFFVARGSDRAEVLAAAMRQAIWKYAPDVTIARVKTLDSQISDSLATERFQTMVLMAFGVAALLLAMLGIYGVLSYSVVTRRQEIGVRMALGATRGSIYGLTMAEAGVPVFAGLAAGLLASFLAAGVIRKLLFGIRTVDPSVILIVTGFFLIAAAAAAFLPARRAASIDPMSALRSE